MVSDRQLAIPESFRTCQHVGGEVMFREKDKAKPLFREMSKLRKGRAGGSLAFRRCRGEGVHEGLREQPWTGSTIFKCPVIED